MEEERKVNFMGKGFSVSATQGDIAPEHDRREYEPENADRRLTVNNRVIIDTPDERQAFNDLFAGSIDAANAKQKRKDRLKSHDYLSEIEADNKVEKPFYEYVFQIGNNETNGVTTDNFNREAWARDKQAYDIWSCMNNDPDRLNLKKVLDSEMGKLQERYPAFHFWSVIGHDDEPNGTYHYHVRFTPVGKGYSKGMQERCSLTKALENMGFKSKGAEYGIMQWQNDVKAHIAEAMEKEGYHREFMSNEEEHLSVPLFKLKTEKEQLAAEIKEIQEGLDDARASYRNVSDLRRKEEKKLKAAKEGIADIEVGAYEDAYAQAQIDLAIEREEQEAELAEERALGQLQIDQELENLRTTQEWYMKAQAAYKNEIKRLKVGETYDKRRAQESEKRMQEALPKKTPSIESVVAQGEGYQAQLSGARRDGGYGLC